MPYIEMQEQNIVNAMKPIFGDRWAPKYWKLNLEGRIVEKSDPEFIHSETSLLGTFLIEIVQHSVEKEFHQTSVRSFDCRVESSFRVCLRVTRHPQFDTVEVYNSYRLEDGIRWKSEPSPLLPKIWYNGTKIPKDGFMKFFNEGLSFLHISDMVNAEYDEFINKLKEVHL
jgi:hypothetical protein